MYGIGEGAAITIYSLYLFDITHLMDYEIDFLGLALILLLDILIFVIRLIGWLAYGKISADKVNP